MGVFNRLTITLLSQIHGFLLYFTPSDLTSKDKALFFLKKKAIVWFSGVDSESNCFLTRIRSDLSGIVVLQPAERTSPRRIIRYQGSFEMQYIMKVWNHPEGCTGTGWIITCVCHLLLRDIYRKRSTCMPVRNHNIKGNIQFTKAVAGIRLWTESYIEHKLWF